ncbi:MAG TPA: coproporphyrinogen-III oxidase family protein, partial [Candidatus Obscuribacterales bacterium]
RCVLEAECEISLETTPHAITGEKLAQWRKLGINRLSIGVESLDDNELAAMGRDHTHDEAVKGIQLACGSGMPSVCVDLMYGLPTQSVSSLKRTIGEILALSRIYPNLNHVSAYGLHIETNSPLYMRFPKDSPSYPGEEEYRAMFFALVEMLEAEGFFHYEVSNFARTGWQSRHNLNYWSNSEYLAFGVSAHRYISGCRSSNWRSLTRYMRDCLGDETREAIDEKTRLKEAIMLGLRLRNGIEVEQFNARYEVDFLARFGQQIDKLTDCGMLTLDGGRLFISKEHVPISNSIIAEFF